MSRRDELRKAAKAQKAEARASQSPLVDELQRSLGTVRVKRAMQAEKSSPPPGTKPARRKPHLKVVK